MTRRSRREQTGVLAQAGDTEDMDVLEAETRNMVDVAAEDVQWNEWGEQILETVADLETLTDEQVATLAQLLRPKGGLTL